MIKECTICGKEFEARSVKHLYCSTECNYEASKRKKKEGRAKKRAENKKNEEHKAEAKKKQKDRLSRDATDANQRGMTYGTYIAYKKRGWLNAC